MSVHSEFPSQAKTVLVVTVLPSINDLQFRETNWETSVSRSVHPRELSYIICKMDFYADRELGVIIAPRDVTVSSYNCLVSSRKASRNKTRIVDGFMNISTTLTRNL